ncbi:RNA-directed DNA polymerase, eukaryota [Tanacetum coccineum]
MSIRGVFVDGDWKTDTGVVKDAFKVHFAAQFKQPANGRLKLNISFINRLSTEQAADMDRGVSRDEIRTAVWNCGENKSPGPDGYTPISLIGCVYKVTTKILANRLATVISDLVSDIQSAFVANRQILDGPFILNELLVWCKRKKKQAMIFKVDFAKAYDSVRWDYLLDVLHAFGFSPNWCRWIRGTFSSAMASILVNGSPTSEFPFFCGLKQGDPLAPYLFILIMESLHILFSRATNDGFFKGVMIGDCMSRKHAWGEMVQKLHSRLSNWKVKTLSIGGRLTLLKSVLGASPLYNMSIYKVPKGVLNDMEAIRSNFFNGADSLERKITWVSWDKVLASKKNGGLGVSSFHALNRALLSNWVWRFISQDGSLWYRIIQALYGQSFELHAVGHLSLWCSILREMHLLKSKGFDFVSHCKKRVGDGHCTRFWYDKCFSDQPFHVIFPRLFALETDTDLTVASKLGSTSLEASFRRPVRDGVERQQLLDLNLLTDSILLSSSKDRWICDLSGDGEFRVKDARIKLDDVSSLLILLKRDG